LNKVAQIKNFLKQEKLGAFLVLTKINRQFLSGFTGSHGILFIANNKSVLFVDDRYLIRARTESPLSVKKLDTLRLALRDYKRVGVEDTITLRELSWLKKLGRGFRETKNVVENIRAIKSPAEVAHIRKGQEIVDRIFRHLRKFVKPGKTEAEVALEIESMAKTWGADGLAFDPIVAFGANAAAPHHLSGKQKIGRSNFLLLDFGILVKGYHSDFTRTLFIGRPNKKQAEVYSTVMEAQALAIAAVRAGAKARAVDAAARGYITARGHGSEFTHNTGHGVGLQIHEQPNFSRDSEDILRPGMIVTIEPGIYIEGWGGVRIEDMVEVTSAGPRIFSKIPKDRRAMVIN